MELLLRAEDRLATVRAAIDAEGVTVEGSRGQRRGHPLLGMERALRRELIEAHRVLRIAPSRDRDSIHIGRGGRLRADLD